MRQGRTLIWNPEICVSEANTNAETTANSRAYGAKYIWLPDQAGHMFRICVQLALHLSGMTMERFNFAGVSFPRSGI